MHPDTLAYNDTLDATDKATCDLLASEIDRALPDAENKIWHRHPVWFLDGNPVAGYHKLKHCVRLLFWSGQSFSTPGLSPEGSFKAAEIRYTAADQVDTELLARWLAEARDKQWNYRDIRTNRGQMVPLRGVSL